MRGLRPHTETGLRMLKRAFSILFRLGMHALRFLFVCVGAYFAGFYPVELWADERRAANLAAHHVPNMDPGVMAVIALVVTVPIVAVLLVGELARMWALKGKPLSPPAAAMLGAVAAGPVGYSALPGNYSSNLFIFLASAACVTVFYGARSRWLAWVRRRGERRDSGQCI